MIDTDNATDVAHTAAHHQYMSSYALSPALAKKIMTQSKATSP